MSYPIDLDEIPTAKLFAEIGRRMRLEMVGKCSYCAMPQTIGSCKLPERHNGADRVALVLVRAEGGDE